MTTIARRRVAVPRSRPRGRRGNGRRRDRGGERGPGPDPRAVGGPVANPRGRARGRDDRRAPCPPPLPRPRSRSSSSCSCGDPSGDRSPARAVIVGGAGASDVRATSDAEGVARVELGPEDFEQPPDVVLGEGRAGLRVVAEGFAASELLLVDAPPNEPDAIAVRLVGGAGRLVGEVLAANGELLAGAEVGFWPQERVFDSSLDGAGRRQRAADGDHRRGRSVDPRSPSRRTSAPDRGRAGPCARDALRGRAGRRGVDRGVRAHGGRLGRGPGRSPGRPRSDLRRAHGARLAHGARPARLRGAPDGLHALDGRRGRRDLPPRGPAPRSLSALGRLHRSSGARGGDQPVPVARRDGGLGRRAGRAAGARPAAGGRGRERARGTLGASPDRVGTGGLVPRADQRRGRTGAPARRAARGCGQRRARG